MAYVSIPLKKDLIVDSIVTIHYFEYMNDFSFEGESHDFWEFLCVDKGVVDVMAGSTPLTLQKGEIIFHKPNEFHKLKSNGKVAPNLVVVSFHCDSPCMSYLTDRIFSITETERNLIAQIIVEAKRSIASPLDDPYLQKMKVKEITPFGSQQLIHLYLEELLLRMIARLQENQPAIRPVKSTKQTNDNLIYERVVAYLEENLTSHLSIDAICRQNLIGRSQLQKLFRDRDECGVITYFSRMKINRAKVLIRENDMNFTQISDYLGYTSVHYFSRQFKKLTGMTPSEYASSIKVLSEKTWES